MQVSYVTFLFIRLCSKTFTFSWALLVSFTVNKQLNDKERVAAALENSHLLGVVEGCLATAGRRGGEVISV